RTTAAAVSSQLLSMPRKVRLSLMGRRLPEGSPAGNTSAMASQSRQPFLLTRPARQGARFAAALRQRFGEGIRLVTSPLLAPLFLRPELPAGAATLIFTSETGVEAFRRISAEQPQAAHSA